VKEIRNIEIDIIYIKIPIRHQDIKIICYNLENLSYYITHLIVDEYSIKEKLNFLSITI
jgi:hypothetical protein